MLTDDQTEVYSTHPGETYAILGELMQELAALQVGIRLRTDGSSIIDGYVLNDDTRDLSTIDRTKLSKIIADNRGIIVRVLQIVPDNFLHPDVILEAGVLA